MKKPSKILSMVLAVMMVMSSVVGLNSTAAKAAGISGGSYSPSASGALDATISKTLKYDLYDKEGNVIKAGQELTQGTGAENILNYVEVIDASEYKKIDPSSSNYDVNRGDVYYIEFVQDAKQVENYAINEVQLKKDTNKVVALLDLIYTEKANNGSIKYRYAFIVPNDLLNNMALSLNFVVEQKGDETPSAQVEFGGFDVEATEIREAISVTAEEKALTNGEAFKLTVKPNKGYGFAGPANDGLKLYLVNANGKVVGEAGGYTAAKVAGKLYEFEISSAGVAGIFTAAVENGFGPFKLIVAKNDGFAGEISEAAAAETITLVDPENGEIAKESVEVKFGETFNIEVTPETDYKLVSLNDGAEPATALENVEDDHLGAGKVWYEVNGNKATVMFSTDASVNESSGLPWENGITIQPVLEQATTISFNNSTLYTSDKVKFLFENGKTTSDKLYSKDTVKVTLVNDNKDKVLNEDLKTFLATGIASGENWDANATAGDVLFTYIGENEQGNYEYELSCKTSWTSEIDTSTVVVLDYNKSYDSTLPAFTKVPAAEEADTFVPSFYFNSLLSFENATYAIDKIALYDYDEANEKYNSTLVNELTEGENCLLQFELNTNNGDGREVRDLISLDYNGEDILANVTSETDKETGVTTYSYKFVAGQEAEFNFNFGDIKSAYLTTVVEGDGSLYFVDAWGKIKSISEIDAVIAEGETTVYIEVFSEEELVSFVVTDEDGKEVETKFIESNSTYELVVPKEAKLTITAKFGEEAVSYPIINGAPEVDKDTNNGYLTITLPALGQTEAYVGDAIKVTAVPNEGYKLDKVFAYVGEAADGALVPMENNEGSFIVPENVTDYVKFVAIFVKDETPVEPDPKPEYPTANEWHQNEDGTWSFIDEEGQLLTGWQNNIKGWEGQWFYFDANGIMVTGWKTGIPGWKSAWFYFDKTTGVMKTDWQNNIPGYEGQWFFFDKSTGEMYCNSWYKNWDGSWYYFGTDGVMLTNTYTPDGYYVDANGVWVA